MRLLNTLVVLGVGVVTGIHGSAFGAPLQGIVFHATKANISAVKPGAGTSEEALRKRWGQFELLVDKEQFPLPAPNCRGRIILRMPAVDPDSKDAEPGFKRRWEIFQGILGLAAGERQQLEIRIADRPFVAVARNGQRTLKYCNAYIESSL